MNESDGVDISTRDGEEKAEWRSADDIDWVAIWESFGGDTPGPNHPRDWLGDTVDEWAAPTFRVALALRLHPKTPTWSMERASAELKAAIQNGDVYQGAQDVVWPVEAVI